jgi:hypothetical protein
MGVVEEDPRAWLKPNPLLTQQHKKQQHSSTSSSRRPQTEPAHGELQHVQEIFETKLFCL